MAITLTGRKTIRQQITTLLDEVTTFVAVYDHEKSDFKHESPVGMVHSDGTRADESVNFNREYHRFIITLMWQRQDDDLTEDYIDDLALEVRQKLVDNAQLDGYWEDLIVNRDFSEMDYVFVDGRLYRRERMSVTAFVAC